MEGKQSLRGSLWGRGVEDSMVGGSQYSLLSGVLLRALGRGALRLMFPESSDDFCGAEDHVALSTGPSTGDFQME